MTNEPIDWAQPIELETDPPRPATARWVYPDGSGADVYADWYGIGGDDWMPTDNNGLAYQHLPRVRNVRPAAFEARLAKRLAEYADLLASDARLVPTERRIEAEMII